MMLATTPAASSERRTRYRPPSDVVRAPLNQIIVQGGRQPPADRQLDLLRTSRDLDVSVYYAGDLSLLDALRGHCGGARGFR